MCNPVDTLEFKSINPAYNKVFQAGKLSVGLVRKKALTKTILITGATDGIGLETAKKLVSEGHRILIHGRSESKLKAVVKTLLALRPAEPIDFYLADLSKKSDVEKLADEIIASHKKLDVLINNAGVYKVPYSVTSDGLDVRFVVNTIAPYLLTQKLSPIMKNDSRIINLSSAAQAPVNMKALMGDVRLEDMEAYAQSKLAITSWSRKMALENADGPIIISVNPGSLLASKMVKEGFGVEGNDLSIGADILMRAALSEEFAGASGQYFDNDMGSFSQPHRDAVDTQIAKEIVEGIEQSLAKMTHQQGSRDANLLLPIKDESE